MLHSIHYPVENDWAVDDYFSSLMLLLLIMIQIFNRFGGCAFVFLATVQ